MTEKPKNQTEASGIPPALILMMITSLAGIGIAVTIILAEQGNTPNQPRIIEPPSMVSLINAPAPDFTLTNLEGEEVTLSDLQGRVVFLNFWATWCVPCRREMPAFEEFMESQAEFGDEGAIILAVNDGETAEEITSFFEEINVTGIPVLLDTTSELRDTYGIFAMPTTYVIDGQGVVRNVKFGEIFPEDFEAYLASVTAP